MRGTIFNKILTYAKYSSILRRKPEGIDLISPIQLFGNWTDGYALDLHTEPIKERHYTMGNAGHDSSVRTELADALYWYKYGSRRRFLAVISRTAASFIIEKQAQWMIDVIVAVPSSSTQRRFSPSGEIAELTGYLSRIRVIANAVKKIKRTPELKSIFDPKERKKLLGSAFTVQTTKLKDKRVLIIDDLYRSGATLEAVAEAVRHGGAKEIFVLTITKTRVHR